MGFNIHHVFYWIESLGIISFALSGILLAKKKDFDIVGVYIIAWVTAFGGGTLRDVILDNQPVYWIEHAEYPLILLFIVIGISLFKSIKIKASWLFIPDAMGMSIFAVTTAKTAYHSGHPMIIIGLLSTIVATFGGVIRDSLCQEIPTVFKKQSTLYASLAFSGGCLFAIMQKLNIWNDSLNMIIVAILIFIARVVSNYFGIKLKI